MGESKLFRFIYFGSKNTKLKITLCLVSASLVVTTTLIVLSSLWKMYKGPTPEPKVLEVSRESEISKEDDFKTYELKHLSVGFMDKKETRMAYAQFSLVFNCPDEACKKNLLLHHAQILDTIFEVGSEFFVEDFVYPSATEGFSRFKSKINLQLEKKFANLAPKSVVIQDWFMN
jgi:hypothetical protein